MSISNVENDGVWKQGGTYTFDFDSEITSTYPGSDGIWYETGWRLIEDGSVYLNNYYYSWYLGYIATDGQSNIILFDNNTTITPSDDPGTPFEGAMEGLTIDSTEDLGGGVTRYTVTVTGDIATGTYYLREAFGEGWAFVS
jgi:hypothetical protein